MQDEALYSEVINNWTFWSRNVQDIFKETNILTKFRYISINNKNACKDEEYITLKDKRGTELKLKYVPDGEGILLYEKSTYEYKGEGKPEGLLGLWTQDNGWSFEFTEDGKFGEEGIFFGHYRVDESDSSIKLMYDDPIPDAILYYSLDGDKLTIDYPWPMVTTDKSKSTKKWS